MAVMQTAPVFAAGPVYGGTLTIGTPYDLAEINPFFTQNTLSANLIEMIYESLINLDEQFNMVPWLAKSWEVSSDGKEWKFHLADGIKFHDGNWLTADDVVFTFTVLAKLPPGVYTQAMINVASVSNENGAVVFRLKGRDQSFPMLLRWVSIVPRYLFGDDGKSLASSLPVGSGPFKVKSFSTRLATLVANHDYRRGRPFLDEINIAVMESKERLLAGLLSGGIDIVIFFDANQWSTLADIPDIRSFSYRNWQLFGIFLNLADPKFRDTRVRMALNLAIHRDDLLRLFPPDEVSLAATVTPTGSVWANTDLTPYGYDPVKALRLLQEAGWSRDLAGNLNKDGQLFELNILVPEGSTFLERMLQATLRDLEELGVQVRIIPRSHQQLVREVMVDRSFDAAVFPYSQPYPIEFDRALWSKTESGNFNFSSYDNPEATNFLEVARHAATLVESRAAYRDFQRVIHDDPPLIYLFWRQQKLLCNKRVHELESHPFRFFSEMRRVWVDAP